MKSAVIFSMPTGTANGFCWRWRSADKNEAESQKQFAFYYECLIDAQANGYLVRLQGALGENAPGRGSVAD